VTISIGHWIFLTIVHDLALKKRALDLSILWFSLEIACKHLWLGLRVLESTTWVGRRVILARGLISL